MWKEALQFFRNRKLNRDIVCLIKIIISSIDQLSWFVFFKMNLLRKLVDNVRILFVINKTYYFFIDLIHITTIKYLTGKCSTGCNEVIFEQECCSWRINYLHWKYSWPVIFYFIFAEVFFKVWIYNENILSLHLETKL